MSNLISGKEAAQAVLNGEVISFESVDGRIVGLAVYLSINEILNERNVDGFELRFYTQPKTIKINNIEIPAPFEPKDGDIYYFLYPDNPNGYGHNRFNSPKLDYDYMQFGAWDSEEKIKEVVKVVRNIFKGE